MSFKNLALLSNNCRYANELSIGDEVLLQIDDNDELTPSKILNVSDFMMQGK